MTRGFARAEGGDGCAVGHALRRAEFRRITVDKVRRYPAACIDPTARVDGFPGIEAGFPGARSG